MNARKLVSTCLFATLTAVSALACQTAEGELDEMAVGLAALPEDLDARATALDQLADLHGGDERVQTAIRELEAAHSAALLREVELSEDRRVGFYQTSSGSIVVVERGPQGVPSALEARGLRSAAETWAALLPDEPMPAALLVPAEAETIAPELRAASPRPHLVPASGGGAQASRPEGSVARALGLSPDGFMAQGGCSTRSAPWEGDYSGIVFSLCTTNHANGFWGQATASHARWRVASFAGGGFNFKLMENDALVSFTYVAPGQWVNFQVSRMPYVTTRKWSCGFLGMSTCLSHTWHNNDANLRVEVVDAMGDGFHIGSLWFEGWNDQRIDAQPW